MTASTWKRLVEPLLPAGQRWEYWEVPDWQGEGVEDGLFYRAPARLTLRGIWLVTTPRRPSLAGVFRVGRPLYTPMNPLETSGLITWTPIATWRGMLPADSAEFLAAIAEALGAVQEEDALIRWIAADPNGWPFPSPGYYEDVAGACVLLGDDGGALAAADQLAEDDRLQHAERLEQGARDAANPTDYERTTRDRFAALIRLLETQGLAEAQRELETSAHNEAEHLGLARD